jgi:hypothetical protein
VETRQDSQQGWKFSSQGAIQRLTNCGENQEQSAGIDIQLTRHNPKTHMLWRKGRTISKDGHSAQGTIQRLTRCKEKAGQSTGVNYSAHKAQFKDSLAVEKDRTISRDGNLAQGTIQRLTSYGENPEQSTGMDIQFTRHNSMTHNLWRKGRTVIKETFSSRHNSKAHHL